MSEKQIVIGLMLGLIVAGMALSAGFLLILPVIALLLYCGKGL